MIWKILHDEVISCDLQSETPEEFHHSQFGGAYVLHGTDLSGKQISVELAVFDENEGNLRGGKMTKFQLLIEVCIYESYYLSHTSALMFRRKRKLPRTLSQGITTPDVLLLALSLTLRTHAQCLCNNSVYVIECIVYKVFPRKHTSELVHTILLSLFTLLIGFSPTWLIRKT